jgi:hypothetical protein
MALAQGNLCFCGCGRGPPFIAEHWTPVAIGNAEKPDCLLAFVCAKQKTKRDMRDIWHVKRLAFGRTQYDKRKRNGSKLRGRGFDKTQRRTFKGKVEKR